MIPWKPPPLIAALLACAMSMLGVAGLAHAIRARAAEKSHALPVAGRDWLRRIRVTPQLVQRGARLFLNSCAHCHGRDARGNEGPDLHDLPVSDRRIATVIVRGIKGEMPSFAKKHGHDDIVAIVAYLRTLK